MCGIAGLYSNSIGIDFDRFLDSLKHRGPDGRGVFKDPHEDLWLGHRRLKILDLSESAAQPMPYANKRYWITFNGEIYNFLELRLELQHLGYSFRTDSDTEVILAAYCEWKEACQLKFNGMWTFAIWDSKEKNLFLSRDRFGVKPLYYYYDKGCFAFASETKSFLHFPVEIDDQRVSEALRGYPIEALEETLFKGVKRLLPGHFIQYSKAKGLSITQYWNTLDHLHSVPSGFEEQVEAFRELFFDACRLRMRSDVPIGTSLSGGLDSSSVFCTLMQIQQGKKELKERIPIHSQSVFTALYPHTSQDEFRFAKEVIQYTQATSHFSSIECHELIQNYETAVVQFEEIFDLPIGPWLLYRDFRKKGILISIDGHGADELFVGYHRQVQEALYNAVNPFKYNSLRKIFTQMYEPQVPERIPYSAVLKKGIKERLPSLFPPSEESNRWIHSPPTRPLPQPAYRNHSKFKNLSSLSQLLYEDFHTFSLPTILRNFDRCSMAHGIEVRAPFMDWRIVCMAFSLPDSSKIAKGYTKRILREAMKGILPESIRTRKSKIGFSNPTTEWFRAGLKPFILDKINSASFLSSTIWDGPEIRNFVLNAYEKGNYAEAKRCWEFIQADTLLSAFKREIVS